MGQKDFQQAPPAAFRTSSSSSPSYPMEGQKTFQQPQPAALPFLTSCSSPSSPLGTKDFQQPHPPSCLPSFPVPASPSFLPTGTKDFQSAPPAAFRPSSSFFSFLSNGQKTSPAAPPAALPSFVLLLSIISNGTKDFPAAPPACLSVLRPDRSPFLSTGGDKRLPAAPPACLSSLRSSSSPSYHWEPQKELPAAPPGCPYFVLLRPALLLSSPLGQRLPAAPRPLPKLPFVLVQLFSFPLHCWDKRLPAAPPAAFRPSSLLFFLPPPTGTKDFPAQHPPAAFRPSFQLFSFLSNWTKDFQQANPTSCPFVLRPALLHTPSSPTGTKRTSSSPTSCLPSFVQLFPSFLLMGTKDFQQTPPAALPCSFVQLFSCSISQWDQKNFQQLPDQLALPVLRPKLFSFLYQWDQKKKKKKDFQQAPTSCLPSFVQLFLLPLQWDRKGLPAAPTSCLPSPSVRPAILPSSPMGPKELPAATPPGSAFRPFVSQAILLHLSNGTKRLPSSPTSCLPSFVQLFSFLSKIRDKRPSEQPHQRAHSVLRPASSLPFHLQWGQKDSPAAPNQLPSVPSSSFFLLPLQWDKRLPAAPPAAFRPSSRLLAFLSNWDKRLPAAPTSCLSGPFVQTLLLPLHLGQKTSSSSPTSLAFPSFVQLFAFTSPTWDKRLPAAPPPSCLPVLRSSSSAFLLHWDKRLPAAPPAAFRPSSSSSPPFLPMGQKTSSQPQPAAFRPFVPCSSSFLSTGGTKGLPSPSPTTCLPYLRPASSSFLSNWDKKDFQPAPPAAFRSFGTSFLPSSLQWDKRLPAAPTSCLHVLRPARSPSSSNGGQKELPGSPNQMPSDVLRPRLFFTFLSNGTKDFQAKPHQAAFVLRSSSCSLPLQWDKRKTYPAPHQLLPSPSSIASSFLPSNGNQKNFQQPHPDAFRPSSCSCSFLPPTGTKELSKQRPTIAVLPTPLPPPPPSRLPSSSSSFLPSNRDKRLYSHKPTPPAPPSSFVPALLLPAPTGTKGTYPQPHLAAFRHLRPGFFLLTYPTGNPVLRPALPSFLPSTGTKDFKQSPTSCLPSLRPAFFPPSSPLGQKDFLQAPPAAFRPFVHLFLLPLHWDKKTSSSPTSLPFHIFRPVLLIPLHWDKRLQQSPTHQRPSSPSPSFSTFPPVPLHWDKRIPAAPPAAFHPSTWAEGFELYPQ
ncbi:nascent polypeptide-associated complex subunit alpha, muscle-specific form-like [Macrobrachium nipponense]|uniref:nascent polypeptide-associated complex subunit alpha, muscle-specific form-like n=1 Tax=Macrobrachium nipponense TaxID=159736 RepID=UPI0030C7D4D6